MPGPMSGIRVLELNAIGPVPFCGMLLADMGADVIRIDRVQRASTLMGLVDVCGRGRRSIALDLKDPTGLDLMHRLVSTADVLLEGFRPGVAERLGIGPDVIAELNPRLVYGRMTGWGQEGPMAQMAGHDINYIGMVGALHTIGVEAPVPPLNLVGDYGGGALYLAVGILAALNERTTSGRGQVVDVAMTDGAASLMTPTYQLAGAGLWVDERNSNLLDGAAPFYRVYETADGGSVAVGALEPNFYDELLRLLDIDPAELPPQMSRAGWHLIEERIGAAFIAESRQHWEAVFSGSDACVTPVLTLAEAPHHPHNQARMTFMNIAGHPEPAPAPRFSRTPSILQEQSARSGADTVEVLTEVGLDAAEIERLCEAGVAGVAEA